MLIDVELGNPETEDSDRPSLPEEHREAAQKAISMRVRAAVIGIGVAVSTLVVGWAFRDPHKDKTVVEHSPISVERPISSYSPVDRSR